MRALILVHAIASIFLLHIHAAPVVPRAEVVRNMESAGLLEARNWNAGAVKTRRGAIYARGLAASQFRLTMLTKSKADLEFRMQLITEARARLANEAASANQKLQTLPPGSSEAKQVQAQIKSIQDSDSQLESQSKQLEAQHAAVVKEIEDVKKIIGKNVENGFKIFANGRRS